MPVADLLTEQQLASGGLRRIAKLRKGGKEVSKRTGKEYPVDLDYFRVVFEPEHADLLEDWIDLYGEKPTEFQYIYLNANTAAEALDYWKEEWNTSGTLVRRCDGCIQHLWYNKNTGFWSKQKITCAADAQPPCECSLVGRMNFIFPEFTQRTGVLGYISIETGSAEDIRELMSQLKFIETTYGTLRGVPLILGRAKRKTTAPEIVDDKRTGKRISTTRSFLYLHPVPEFMRTHLLPALANNAPSVQPVLSATAATPALPAGDDLPSWYDNDAQRMKYITWLNTRQLTIEEAFILTGKLPSEFPNGRTACEAVDAALTESEDVRF